MNRLPRLGSSTIWSSAVLAGRVLHLDADEVADRLHARCVMEVLFGAVSPGAMEKLRQQLPEEFEPLVSAGSEGRMQTP